MPRRKNDAVNDAVDGDVFDGEYTSLRTEPRQIGNGQLTHYTAKDLMRSIKEGFAEWISQEARQNRAYELVRQQTLQKGELAHIEKAQEGSLMLADVQISKTLTIANIHANKEMNQEEIRARADIEVTEYQEHLAKESAKREAKARQSQVDDLKMKRQLQEVDDMGLSPQDAEFRKEYIRRVWKGE